MAEPDGLWLAAEDPNSGARKPWKFFLPSIWFYLIAGGSYGLYGLVDGFGSNSGASLFAFLLIVTAIAECVLGSILERPPSMTPMEKARAVWFFIYAAAAAGWNLELAFATRGARLPGVNRTQLIAVILGASCAASVRFALTPGTTITPGSMKACIKWTQEWLDRRMTKAAKPSPTA